LPASSACTERNVAASVAPVMAERASVWACDISLASELEEDISSIDASRSGFSKRG